MIAMAMGIAIALAAAELSLRIYVTSRGWTPNCYATGLAFFIPHPTAGYTLRPGLRLKSTTYDVTVNQDGFRGPPLESSQGRPRLVVLGGSSVFGYLVPDGQDSCRVLEEMLDAEAASDSAPQAEVINAGVPGYNLTQCCERYRADIAALQPDFVLLYLGWNDTPFLIRENQNELDRTPAAPGWLKRFLSHSVLYGFVRYRLFPAQNPVFAPPALSTTKVSESGGLKFRQELQRLIDVIEESGALPIISTQVMAADPNCQGLDAFLGDSDEQIEANRRIGTWITEQMRRAAAENGILLIDCAAELPCDSSILGDAIHLTAEGHRAVARCWKQALAPLLSGQADSAQLTTEQENAP
ncbi:MAG: SGNH/GDSL hydrolase family protein [bacterium]|nr:SGNH/GDSL hydrolase family protein [bacterium]